MAEHPLGATPIRMLSGLNVTYPRKHTVMEVPNLSETNATRYI